MAHLVVYATTNTPGKRDATGAFIPGALALGKALGPEALLRPVSGAGPFPERDGELVLSVYEESVVTRASVFCHGTQHTLQVGLDNRVEGFAAFFEEMPLERINLFACSAGKGQGSIAWDLARTLRCEVLAHTTVGHSFHNPNLRLFGPDGNDLPVLDAYPWLAKGLAARRLQLVAGAWKRLALE